ncbi:hypothetical protein HPB52_004687 [Rhipicephalus sanguineus]|uniref:Uncharacterized protein n=1 Tax=Rhipicephalus sanguineus TaxID=34632 RepID=A0A9D4QH99_RHISA|nr:hypothetical protein HPB52_004687 [Rhipicephalus sanguineus]
MAAEDIDRLCCIFYRVQIGELHCVDDQKFPWLAPIRGLSLSPAVDSIRCSLKAIQGQAKLGGLLTAYRTKTTYFIAGKKKPRPRFISQAYISFSARVGHVRRCLSSGPVERRRYTTLDDVRQKITPSFAS